MAPPADRMPYISLARRAVGLGVDLCPERWRSLGCVRYAVSPVAEHLGERRSLRLEGANRVEGFPTTAARDSVLALLSEHHSI